LGVPEGRGWISAAPHQGVCFVTALIRARVWRRRRAREWRLIGDPTSNQRWRQPQSLTRRQLAPPGTQTVWVVFKGSLGGTNLILLFVPWKGAKLVE